VIGLWALATLGSAEPAQPTEGEVKAAFVYNFILLAPWEVSVEKVDLCIVGNTRLRRDLERLSGRTFGTNRVLSTRPATADSLDSCQAVFISGDQAPQLDRLLSSLKGKKTLTVSDSSGFGRRGVMFNLTLQDDRVRFEANTVAAIEAGLPISSRLLALATVVFEAGK
jgi:hypothetical protein